MSVATINTGSGASMSEEHNRYYARLRNGTAGAKKRRRVELNPEILRRRIAGETLKKIASDLGVSKSFVQIRLLQLGCDDERAA